MASEKDKTVHPGGGKSADKSKGQQGDKMTNRYGTKNPKEEEEEEVEGTEPEPVDPNAPHVEHYRKPKDEGAA